MRNSVTNFQLVIKAYLDELSQIDEQFAVKGVTCTFHPNISPL